MTTIKKGAARGEANSQSKLKAPQVIEIRRRAAAGENTQAALAREFGVGAGRISDIVNRKLWAHI